jgi:predicted nicotinamide N-methyase
MTPTELRKITQPRRSALAPELIYPSLPDSETLERFRTRHERVIGANVPYWAVAWPGSQAIARYLLDRPELVAGRPVVDFGCGNGLAATAAMRAGASSAIAIDIDPNALAATAETARLNRVEVTTELRAFDRFTAPEAAVICAGDLWYEPVAGRRATGALHALARTARLVLFADPGRPGRPRRGARKLACYALSGSPEFERAGSVEAAVFALGEQDILPARPPHARGEHGIAHKLG